MPITVVDHRVVVAPTHPDGSPYGAPAEPLRRFATQVPEGTPLLFTPDLHFDRMLKKFIRELPEADGDRRAQYLENSWLATARDIDGWLEFLSEDRAGTSWLDASLEDARAYKRYRLSGQLRKRLNWDPPSRPAADHEARRPADTPML